MKLNLSFLKVCWHKIALALKSKIAIFLYGCLFTGMTFFFANYPNWGTYFSSNGIKDPVKPFLERYMGSIEKTENVTDLYPRDSWKKCLDISYQNSDDDLMWPLIPAMEYKNLYERKLLFFNEAIVKKQLLLKELDRIWGNEQSSHADRSNALFQAIQGLKDIYVSSGFAKQKCQRNYFHENVESFLNKFDEVAYNQYDFQDDSDDFYKGNGANDLYLFYLFDKYNQLIIEDENEYWDESSTGKQYLMARNRFIKHWKSLVSLKDFWG